jgi:very-short-patch-repair endonuclease
MSQRQQFAKDLRQNLTEEERFVWSRLRSRRFAGFKFRRQVVLGSYIVDFVCHAAKLIVELDGGQHTLQRKYDADRTNWLEQAGYRVFRCWNFEVREEWDAFEELLWRELNGLHHAASVTSPSPGLRPPSPSRGEGK